jgi:hypothetical protein
MIKAGEKKSTYKDFIIHELEYTEQKQVRFNIEEKTPVKVEKKEETSKFILMPLPKKYGEESN